MNKTYLESGEYKRKYDNATDSPQVNKALYDCAKQALKHRSGTVFEDMYWIDSDTGKIVSSIIDSTEEHAIIYTESIKQIIKKNQNLIAIHTHPSSMPPSVSDLNSCYKNKYNCGFIACHDGKVFGYTSYEEVNKRIYEIYISDCIMNGYSDYDAQMIALEKLSKAYKINVWEVT